MSYEGSIRDVVIAGGSDIGLLASLLVKGRNPSLRVTVVDDFDSPTPEIGKSTFASFYPNFHDDIGISKERFVRETQPVWKSAALFDDWCGKSFTVPFDNLQFNDESLVIQYLARYENDVYDTIGSEMVAQKKTPFRETDVGMSDVERIHKLDQYEAVAYHLDLDSFTPFLRTVARERGVELYNGRVTSVKTSGDNQSIEKVCTDTREFTGDLYLDATGSARVLAGELENTFTEFDMLLDTAVATRVPIEPSDIVPASIHSSGDHGWMWQIDTQTHRDLGYVYSSSHTSECEAVDEFIAAFPDEDIDRESVAVHSFTSGALDESWTGNCVAIGNASGFVEPLQAFGLSSSLVFVVWLCNILDSHSWVLTDGIQTTFNELLSKSWSEIYEFLLSHYTFADGETAFWQDMSELQRDDHTQYQYYDSTGRTEFTKIVETLPDGGSFADQKLYYLLFTGLGVKSAYFESAGSELDGAEQRREDVMNHVEYVEREVDSLLSYDELLNEFL